MFKYITYYNFPHCELVDTDFTYPFTVQPHPEYHGIAIERRIVIKVIHLYHIRKLLTPQLIYKLYDWQNNPVFLYDKGIIEEDSRIIEQKYPFIQYNKLYLNCVINRIKKQRYVRNMYNL